MVSTQITPFEIIRSETTLSKYPIHNLVKGKPTTIDIHTVDRQGRTIQWEVSANQKYGLPGQLAYKLDTLVINRRIEEAGQPIPEIIVLGSLRQICQSLGLAESGKNKKNITHALNQNALTGITACFQYADKNKVERELKATFTRYSVIFTGEQLPNGQTADGVYLVLNKTYREVLSHSPMRPLDYDYLKSLTPTAQRFYEIISYQIFAALKYRHPYARMRYSDYCLYSAQKRYLHLSTARKQMYKVHQPHKASGYLEGIQFEKGLDQQGNPDWVIAYRPGPKALSEYDTFNRKRKSVVECLDQPIEVSTLEVDSVTEVIPEDVRKFRQSFLGELLDDVFAKMPQMPD
ncbi:MAG: hypothetical protein AAF959_09975 [Cyanobacteria bacterium P01_D01_bin.56]